MWVDRNIVQEDGFVAFTAPLGKDPAFQQRLAAAAVGGLGAAPASRKRSAELVTADPGKRGPSLTGLPGYPEAWTETLRKSHRLNFADPSTLPPEADGCHLADPGSRAARRPGGQAGGGGHHPAAGGARTSC